MSAAALIVSSVYPFRHKSVSCVDEMAARCAREFPMTSRPISVSCFLGLVLFASILSGQEQRDPRIPRPFITSQSPMGDVHRLLFSRDGRFLYAAGADKTIHMWA